MVSREFSTNQRKILYSDHVIVYCAIAPFEVIKPYFFEEEEGVTVIMKSIRYVKMIQTELRRRRINVADMFLQDGATPHTTKQSITFLPPIFTGSP